MNELNVSSSDRPCDGEIPLLIILVTSRCTLTSMNETARLEEIRHWNCGVILKNITMLGLDHAVGLFCFGRQMKWYNLVECGVFLHAWPFHLHRLHEKQFHLKTVATH